MITLLTGLPGAAKTLYIVTRIAAQLEKRKKENPGSDVYYYGIKGLKHPWIEIDEPERWYELPVGSAIIIDEAQTIFRPRSNSAKVPQHVSEFETHRHRGFDVFLVTQHPGLIDSNIRKLVGEHIHIKRSFGSKASMIYTHQGVNNNCGVSNAGSERSTWAHDKKGFDLYDSAELHTHKRKLPKAFFMIIAAPFVLIALLYFFYLQYSDSTMVNGIVGTFDDATGTLLSNDITQVPLSFNSPGQSIDYFTSRVPRISQLPHTAPIYDELTTPVRVPYPAACIELGDRCLCYTEQATPLPLNLSLCREIVTNGYYRDWGDIGTEKMERREERAPAKPASTLAAPSHTYPIEHFPRTANRGSFSVSY